MANEFYALMGRMRYITRWGLMRNTFSENIQEHSHQVAVLAHALALIRRDIAQNACKVIYDEMGIHGVFALFSDPDPTYAKIDNGRWLNDEPYLTIHRMAGDGQVHGLFSLAADYCKGLSRNIRIDTHADNRVMQRCIEKNDFRKCGTISVRDGSPRLAYQWSEQ